MSGQATTTGNPQTSYGSNAVSNRVRHGGDLGSNQYWYDTNASTGEITVNRIARERVGRGSWRNVETEVGTIPRGGNFTPNSNASDAERSHYGSVNGRSGARQHALDTVRRSWDGKTGPPPNTLIYGENAVNSAYGARNNKGEVFADTNRDHGGAATQDELDNDARKLNSRRPSGPNRGTGKLIGNNTSLKAGEVVVYPVTLRQTDPNGRNQDYLKLQMLKYDPKGFGFGQGNLSGVGTRASKKNRTGLGSVILPIPGGIRDSNAASWGDDSMSPADIAMAGAAFEFITKGTADLATEGLKGALKNQEAIKKAMGQAFASMAGGSAGQVLKRAEGAILNPNMELLFNNPTLRQFNFSWKLAPRSTTEAQQVIKIIRFFKQGMAPIRVEPNLFLKAPNTFQLTYHNQNQEHKYLNKFKECALLSCGLDYTPDGNYTTFEDGVMTSYQMTLAFKELDPVYNTDYEDIPDNEIGF